MPQPLSFGPKPSGDISVPLTVEPALGFAYRQPLADGQVADKTNVSVLRPSIAPILILIGSIYGLRGQEVAGSLVHLYAPIVRKILIQGEPILPCLPAADVPSDEALMRMWLQAQRGQILADGEWAGLTYQILQTQGAQQSFSLGRGTLPLHTPPSPTSTRDHLYRRWAGWLRTPRAERPPGIDDVVSAVLRQEPSAFTSHLRMTALAVTHAHQPFWMYTENEAREAIAMSNAKDAVSTTLVEILNHREGTYRFGTALRALGEYLPAAQREIVADLDTVRERDQLLRVLAQLAEQCAISAAKNPFAIVPNDDDLRGLLADVEQHGTRTVAGLIIILAALRYPRQVKESPELGANGQDHLEAV